MEIVNKGLRTFHIDGKALLPGDSMVVSKELAEQLKMFQELQLKKVAEKEPEDKKAK